MLLAKFEFENLEQLIEVAVRRAVEKHLPSHSVSHEIEPKVHYFSRKETAKLLNISLATLANYQKSGKIQFRRIGRKVLFTIDEIEGAFSKVNLRSRKKDSDLKI